MSEMAKIGFRKLGAVGVLILLNGIVCTGEDCLPSPSLKTAAALPPDSMPVSYDFALSKGGGFTVAVSGACYPVESSYSFPHGGENRLTASEIDAGGEPAWRVESHKRDDKHFEVAASGKFYSINRRITLHPNRIEVADTIQNKTADVLGIILSNQINTAGKPVSSVLTPGNYTLFIAAADHGLALVGLDDLYQLQQHTYHRDGVAAMSTDKFGLDGGASYTIQWAVYPTATGDYLDFVNTFRKVEGLNRTVAGAFALVGEDGKTGPDVRSTPISHEIISAKGVKYVSYFYLIAPPDDPGLSLEGIEFTRYPKESALLKKSIAETYRLNPGVKVMYHVAHGLYMTNKPKELFPDSRVIRADGKQVFYGPDTPDYYCQFISRQRFDEGYRWWIFYPTMNNSFGRAMLDAIDYMLEEIGASGMYADGFFSGYADVGGNDGGYTHDVWDGHSVEINHETKTVVRKLGNVAYMARPVLKAVIRKVAAKGGIVITNGCSGPRSLWKENYLTTQETSSGDKAMIRRLYIGPTVTPFGDPTRIKSRQDLYGDVLEKLKFGALYFYFGDEDCAVKDKMIVRHMYPFTREETHHGWAKGRERIVTMVPGVYGWRGDKHLHKVYRSDAEGFLVANEDFSTADSSDVHTELKLADRESAVVEKIPVMFETQKPVNLLVRKYGADGLELCANGRGEAGLTVSDGAFPIQTGKSYRIISDKTSIVTADAHGTLRLPLQLDGETNIGIHANNGSSNVDNRQ